MAHEVETMAYAGEVPWHGLGRKVSPDLTAREMLVEAGLNWTVSKKGLWLREAVTFDAATKEPEEYGYRPVPDHFALVRDSDGTILSTCKKGYKPVQNEEAFDFFKKFVDAGSMKMETAGALRGGRFVWALARMNVEYTVAKNDNLQGFLLMMSPHQVNYSMLFQFTPIRVVCMNTLSMALGSSLKGNKTAFRMVHTATFDDRMKKVAEKALGLATDQMTEFGEAAKVMSKVNVSSVQARDFFMEVLKLPEQDRRDMNEGKKALPKLLTQFEAANLNAPGQNLDNAKGTLWGAFNAVTYVADHVRLENRDNRLFSAWFDAAAVMKRHALDVALKRAA